MKKLSFFLLLWAAYARGQTAADCHCDQTIDKGGTYFFNAKTNKPGQTICIKAGTYPFLSFYNFAGTQKQPYRFVNCGGQVVVQTESGTSGINFSNCQHFVLTGTGARDQNYGFLVTKTAAGQNAVNIAGRSSDAEVEQVEVAGAGFAGIVVKMDPSCDSTTWRGNFAMYNINLHHNYVHDVGGEGFYVGNSFWNSGMVRTCDGVKKTVFPHEIYGLNLHHNRVERTGAEGIQFGCSPDARVHDNVVSNTGIKPFDQFQNNGIQVGGGSGGRLYCNRVTNASGTGIIILGYKTSLTVYNNVIVGTGEYGVLCDDRPGTPLNDTIRVLNNTFFNIGKDAFRFYNEISHNIIANNIVTGDRVFTAAHARPPYIAYYQGAKAQLKNNLFTQSLDSLRFKDVAARNFDLRPDSPAVDAGSDLSADGVVGDLVGTRRPKNLRYDLGAYEYVGDDNRLTCYPSPAQRQVTLWASADIQSVAIYDAGGRLVLSSGPTGAGKEATLSVDHLAAGIYIASVQTSAGVASGKFVKQ